MYPRLVFLLALAIAPHCACAGGLWFGSATLLQDDWAFWLGDDPRARETEYDDRAWTRVVLPHDWSVQQPLRPELASCTGYLPGGVGWYRTKITLPAQRGGEKVFLYFEGVYNRSEVYLNGQRLGQRPNGYVSFFYDATPYVRFDAENTLAVRVDHSRSADSRWYTGSGIYRDVHLIRSGPVHLRPWGLLARPEMLRGAEARVHVDAEVQNETAQAITVTVQHELHTLDGVVVATSRAPLLLPAGSSATSSQSLEVSQAHRWSIDDPYLYQIRTSVRHSDEPIDQATLRTGIRAFSFDPNEGFALNGASMKMRGVCLHHDAGVLGAAVPSVVWRKRLQTLKRLGCNAVRTSHNPQAPEFYELCDELGLLVLNEAFDEWEFPKRKWLRGWNVGEPGFAGSHDFFEEWSGRDLADMVRRDRNHPSIFAWSIGNEVDYPNDPYSHPVLDGTQISQPMFGGYKPDQPDARRLGGIAQRLAAEVRRHDPSRPVTAALAGVVMSNETEYPAALDLVGYNYTEDRYAIDHQRYPQRIIYGSENRHPRDAWLAVRDNRHIFGQFLWTGIDYLGEAGPWPSRGSSAGLVDLTGAVKPRGRFRESLWSDKPVLYLGTEPAPKHSRMSIDAWPIWNYAPDTSVRVLCYTNAATVRLTLNGNPVGEEKAYDAATGVISWDVPFAAGTLEAVGLDRQGVETCRGALRSAGPAARLKLTTDETVVDRRHGIAMIELQVVDAHDVPVMTASQEVTCVVEGAARLVGLEAGNLRDVNDYTDAAHAVFHGRIVAYVQATGAAGSVRVRFSAPPLPEAAVLLTAR